MALTELRDAVRGVGYDAVIIGDFVTFPHVIPVGAYVGVTVTVGLAAPDFPVNPPGGVHIRPRVQHPGDSAHHASPLGPDWIYWSRPYPDWPRSARDISDYLAHVRRLFAQITVSTA